MWDLHTKTDWQIEWEERGSQPLAELQRKDSKWQVRLIDWQGLTEDGIIIQQAKERHLFLGSELSEEERWRWKYEYWIMQLRTTLETKKMIKSGGESQRLQQWWRWIKMSQGAGKREWRKWREAGRLQNEDCPEVDTGQGVLIHVQHQPSGWSLQLTVHSLACSWHTRKDVNGHVNEHLDSFECHWIPFYKNDIKNHEFIVK